MCNIWQNRITDELKPEEFLKLPDSLKDINITGGEPFLRMDLPEIVANIKLAAPKARLVLSTNGFLPKVIEKNIPKILQTDPDFAVRVSLDGWNETHDRIRRIPNGFNMIMETLSILKAAGVKDL
ncbi:MAG TPA: radical SAM protein, partial [Patescibacteria group bacterium]|nr:radical SAM protein [Patescibacteria group bacterium]